MKSQKIKKISVFTLIRIPNSSSLRTIRTWKKMMEENLFGEAKYFEWKMQFELHFHFSFCLGRDPYDVSF